MAAKIKRFTDKEGTLHITDAGEGEPGKPGEAPTPGAPGGLPKAFPPAAPMTPPGEMEAPPAPLEPPVPPEPPEAPGTLPGPGGEPGAGPPGEQSVLGGAEGGAQAQPGAEATQSAPTQAPDDSIRGRAARFRFR